MPRHPPNARNPNLRHPDITKRLPVPAKRSGYDYDSSGQNNHLSETNQCRTGGTDTKSYSIHRGTVWRNRLHLRK